MLNISNAFTKPPHYWKGVVSIAAALFTGGYAATSAAKQTNTIQATNSPLSFERCTVSAEAYEVDAECATFRRHENPQDPNSRLIDLSVVKFPSHSPEPEPDAFTLIQGGPGGSSIDFAIAYGRVLEDIRRKRDILVVDQRGTGRSNLLSCGVPDDDAAQYDLERATAFTKECAEKLSRGNDLRFYTTSVAVEDLEALRIAAGYPQLNIYGVSYGTRVAQHYLRKFPDSARSVILDGVVQVGLNLAGGEIARRWDQSFDKLNKRCQQTPACQQAHGDLRASYEQLQARFSEEPVTVTVPHPYTAKPTEYTFNEFSLFSAARLMAYSDEQLALMPLLLSETKAGHYNFVASQIIQMEENFSAQFATGMHNSVMCAEDAPFVTDNDIKPAEGTLIGPMMSEILRASCTVWPRGQIDDGFHTAFKSDKPALILSGENDPITPPDNGNAAAQMLSNSKHIVVPAHGHGVIARGCVPKLVSLFIENADDDTPFAEVDETCVSRERPLPIFTSTTGPKA